MRARICLASAESVLLRGAAGEDPSGSGVVVTVVVGVTVTVTADASLPATTGADVDRASSCTRSLVASAATSTEVKEKKTLVDSLDCEPYRSRRSSFRCLLPFVLNFQGGRLSPWADGPRLFFYVAASPLRKLQHD